MPYDYQSNAPDFSAILQHLQGMQSPYVTMPAHGLLQDHLGQGITGRLDNAFLAAANTPQGQTAGENVSNVFKGLAGARAQEQQHAMQNAELPAQVGQMAMGYQKSFLDMLKDQAEVDAIPDKARMNAAHADYFSYLATGERDRLRSQAGQRYSSTHIGTDNKMYGIRKDTQQLELIPGQDGVTFHSPGDPSGSGQGLSLFGLAAAASGADPTTASGAKTILQTAQQYQANVAGGRTGATNNANLDKDTAAEFRKTQENALVTSLGKRPTAAEAEAAEKQEMLSGIMNGTYDPKKPTMSLDQRQAQYDKKAGEVKGRFSKYINSNRWRKGEAFDPSQDYGNSATPQGTNVGAPVPGVPQQAAPQAPQVNPAMAPQAQVPGVRKPGDPLALY